MSTEISELQHQIDVYQDEAKRHRRVARELAALRAKVRAGEPLALDLVHAHANESPSLAARLAVASVTRELREELSNALAD